MGGRKAIMTVLMKWEGVTEETEMGERETGIKRKEELLTSWGRDRNRWISEKSEREQ